VLLNIATKLKNAKGRRSNEQIILNVLWYFAVVAVELIVIPRMYQTLVFMRIRGVVFFFFAFQVLSADPSVSTGGQMTVQG